MKCVCVVVKCKMVRAYLCVCTRVCLRVPSMKEGEGEKEGREINLLG